MIGSWSKYTGLVSKKIIKIYKLLMRRRIINNVVLHSVRGINVSWTRVSSESIVTEKRQDK